MYKYKLQRYQGMGSRYRCPMCQSKRKTLTLYVDTTTNQTLSPNVGKCDRLVKCGYHYTPKQYFEDNGEHVIGIRPIVRNKTPVANIYPPSSIHHQLFKASLARYDDNHLISFLNNTFGTAITDKLIERYYIGTSKHWPGATVFWQVDTDGMVRAGKIMLYSALSGKRVKQPFNHITWVHSALRLKHYELVQCFFGQHLLLGNTQCIGIVESEKTALIASIYYPAYVWLAAGSLNNLTAKKCMVLKGRRVYFFPDLNGFELWLAKARQLAGLAKYKVSTFLEDNATPQQKTQGLDLADYLLMCKAV